MGKGGKGKHKRSGKSDGSDGFVAATGKGKGKSSSKDTGTARGPKLGDGAGAVGPAGEPVAVIGGGLAGLACGWGLLQRKLPAVVFDTGKRGPGGRASSRLVWAGECSHVVDHAVQAFTVSIPEVQKLLELMESAGAAMRWRGAVGVVSADGNFRLRDEAAEGPLWIGNSEMGVGAISDWLATQQEVVKDVWVAKLRWADEDGWDLLGQRGQPVKRGRYNYVVMAHNGKCADRLINTAPFRTAAHDPLRCRFTSKASATSDRLELSSLWVCVLEVPRGAAKFEGAFVEGSEVLSWAGNNSAKYKQSWARESDVWTLISIPEYGSSNKCPQEAIPDHVWQKVSGEMRQAFGALLGVAGAAASRWQVLHLQLWGAALPLNVCAQHFVHDPEARVGVCGDWLTAPSVEGALFSGLALAEAIERDLRRAGGLRSTGSKRFVGLGGHAIGHFEPCRPVVTAAQAVDGLDAQGRSSSGGDSRGVSTHCAQAPKDAAEKAPEAAPSAGSSPSARSRQRWRRREVQDAGDPPRPPVGAGDHRAAAEGGAPAISNSNGSEGRGSSGSLRLSALAAWSIEGGVSLVDIGANMSKCKPQDLAEQLARASAAGVGRMILTGCTVKGSLAARRLCEQWSGRTGLREALQHLGNTARQEVKTAGLHGLPELAFTAGVHPHDAHGCDGETIGALRSMASHKQCVAIGECGLDYDRMFSKRDVQLEWCRRQIELAVELGMSLFLHERDRDTRQGARLGSSADLLGILNDCGVAPSRVCVHCYTGPEEELQAYVSRGFFIGLTGFAGMAKRGDHIRSYLRRGLIPLRQLMIETDCPFMMPDKDYLPSEIGLQGRRMEPCAMPAVCRAVAECLGQPEAEVARVTTENAARFFAR